jgi:hypothetical protein
MLREQAFHGCQQHCEVIVIGSALASATATPCRKLARLHDQHAATVHGLLQ